MIKFKRRASVEINSSSMADIAFLLLIFFLVTTTISMDKGLDIVLPSGDSEMEVNKKNLAIITINEEINMPVWRYYLRRFSRLFS